MENESRDFKNIQRINRALDEIRQHAASFPDYPNTSWLNEVSARESRDRKRSQRVESALALLVLMNAFAVLMLVVAVAEVFQFSPDVEAMLRSRIGSDHESGQSLVIAAVGAALSVFVATSMFFLVVVRAGWKCDGMPRDSVTH